MECKGRIKFYDEEMDVQFPEDFNSCKKKIGEMIGLSGDELLMQINLYYNDEDGDKILLTEDNDYKIFFNFLKENDAQKGTSTLIIELKEKSEILVQKISQEMSVYKEKHSEEIINEVDMNEDIMNQIENENLVIKNNKEEDNNNKININENNNKEEENNEKENNNENNLNQQSNQPDNNINQDEQRIKYEETCEYCKAKPLYDVFYYCLQCNIKMCSKCELELGKKHSHPFSKIQTYDQYMNSHINLRKNVNNAVQHYGGAIQNFLGNLSNLISNNIRNNNNLRNQNNNGNNNNTNNNQNKKNYKALVQKMKKDFFELDDIPDEKIEEALIKSDGDINKALDSLFG